HSGRYFYTTSVQRLTTCSRSHLRSTQISILIDVCDEPGLGLSCIPSVPEGRTAPVPFRGKSCPPPGAAFSLISQRAAISTAVFVPYFEAWTTSLFSFVDFSIAEADPHVP